MARSLSYNQFTCISRERAMAELFPYITITVRSNHKYDVSFHGV